LSLDETCDESTVAKLFDVLLGADHGLNVDATRRRNPGPGIPDSLQRKTPYLRHPVFNAHHSETEMLRYLKQLENKDLALNQSMIPLGSCTMKLNATSEMIPITWPQFANLHPFAPGSRQSATPDDRRTGALAVRDHRFRCDLHAAQLRAQGEYAGLLAIRKYHESRHQGARDICLIPSSAHGTNPASAQMAGMRVVIVECDEAGNVDLDDLKAKAAEAGTSCPA
jgi:glycine dehydrogenase